MSKRGIVVQPGQGAVSTIAPGRPLFLYTSGKAGGSIEEQRQTGSKLWSITERERAEICERHGWELLGPSPL
jgi:hypothetical protein